ncbi:MAG: AAA family ATPase [Coriobacteriales bacterium]|jgi:predicted AAA+ superfamily ATPase|nr:AAA family ATPase [Coriobacteriales bacterium]
MQREIIAQLADWKRSKRRKPLLLEGSRQVGKTWVLKEFGRLHYKNTAYLAFDEHPELNRLFATTKDPKRIIENLTIISEQPILPETTLLIFDEIQEAPEALSSLKYFQEQAPQYHLACAGSLLGVALAKPASLPVGKVKIIKLHPMTFTEYLRATGETGLAEYLPNISAIEPVPEVFNGLLFEKLKAYFITGGLPESVLVWSETRDVRQVQDVLRDLLAMYQRDFQQHAPKSLFPKIEHVWASLPSQLSRENKKFLYSLVRPGARAREYEDAIQWLTSAGLAQKVYRLSAPGLPISAYDMLDAFKLYLLDVGLLRRHARLAPSAFAEGNRLFTEFKGAMTENYLLQALRPQFDAQPRYWAQDNPHREVDFIIQYENQIIPVEVKSGEAVRSLSLKKYREKYAEKTGLALRFSQKNLSCDNGLLNIPHYLADQTARLIALAAV